MNVNALAEPMPDTKPELIADPSIKDVYDLLTTSVEESRLIKKMLVRIRDDVEEQGGEIAKVKEELVLLRTHEKRLRTLETIFLEKFADELIAAKG